MGLGHSGHKKRENSFSEESSRNSIKDTKRHRIDRNSEDDSDRRARDR